MYKPEADVFGEQSQPDGQRADSDVVEDLDDQAGAGHGTAHDDQHGRRLQPVGRGEAARQPDLSSLQLVLERGATAFGWDSRQQHC